MKSILDPTFRYVPSASTDLRKTFSRIRREMQKVGAGGTRPPDSDEPRVLLFSRVKQAGGVR
jgi:hypothetical protein